MKRSTTFIANVALMFGFSVATLYAEPTPLNLSFSGTEQSTTLNVQAGAGSSEWNIAGNGTLGPFTYRGVEATNVPPSACPGVAHPYAGGGVFRFEDGSLLMVNLTEGSDCLQFTSTGPEAQCTRTYQITGGTGRFKNASGTIALAETVLAVVFNSSSKPIVFANFGNMTGTLSRPASDSPDGRQ